MTQKVRVLGTYELDSETERVFAHTGVEFVVWTRRIDAPTSFFWGHYYKSFNDAVDYWQKERQKERLAK